MCVNQAAYSLPLLKPSSALGSVGQILSITKHGPQPTGGNLVECYGLNCVPPPNPYVEALTSNMIVLGGGGLWVVIRFR